MSLRNLAYAYSEPDISASYKVDNEDFQVKEILNFEPDGDGDHLFLYVEKKWADVTGCSKTADAIF